MGIRRSGDKVDDFRALRDLAPIFDQIPNLQFWAKDRESRFRACNAGFAAHFGLEGVREIEGRTDFEVSPEPLAREYVQDDKSVLGTGKPIVDKMELVREQDGKLKWYATSKFPLRNAQNLIYGTAGVTRLVNDPMQATPRARGMAEAIHRINTQYGKDWKIPDLAATAGMSVDNFERKFRLLFRATPLKYLNRIRMRAACGLLIHTELSVGDVAKQCGFSDQSYFSKRFFLNFRIRPLEYRRKYRPSA